MYRKNTRRGWKLGRKTDPVIVRFRGPHMGRSGIRAAVGTTAMLGGIFQLLSSPCQPDASEAEETHETEPERREGSP
jgi:hypothetical protein